MEVWKEFIRNGINYKVSDKGEVVSLSSGKIIQQRLDGDGYPTITVGSKKVGRRTVRIHRLVAEHHVENPNKYKEVNHIDGNKQNNNHENLEWCSRSHNVKHSFDMGLHQPPKGSKNGRASLDENKVLEIRDLLSKGCTRYFLAKEYGVSWSCINFIHKDKTWKHV